MQCQNSLHLCILKIIKSKSSFSSELLLNSSFSFLNSICLRSHSLTKSMHSTIVELSMPGCSIPTTTHNWLMRKQPQKNHFSASSIFSFGFASLHLRHDLQMNMRRVSSIIQSNLHYHPTPYLLSKFLKVLFLNLALIVCVRFLLKLRDSSAYSINFAASLLLGVLEGLPDLIVEANSVVPFVNISCLSGKYATLLADWSLFTVL